MFNLRLHWRQSDTQEIGCRYKPALSRLIHLELPHNLCVTVWCCRCILRLVPPKMMVMV